MRPVRFVPVEHVFTPQVQIRALQDISGYVGPWNENPLRRKERAKGQRWALAAGRIYAVDEPAARALVARGYAEFVDPRQLRKGPLSADEVAEEQSHVTIIGPPGVG